jgi:hypothetical protein
VAWRRRVSAGVPERLCRFVAAEWPGADCIHQALRDWEDACLAWVDEHPGSLPFGEYGCGIDVLREAGKYRDRMPLCPKERFPGSHNGVLLGPPPPAFCPFKPGGGAA